MIRLRILAAAPTLVFGLATSPAQAGFGLSTPLRYETAVAQAMEALVLGAGMPRIVQVDDRMGMPAKQPAPSPSSSPPAGGAMQGGGMMDDDKMDKSMQQPMPAPGSPPAASGGMQPGMMMMDGKMAMPPAQPTPNASGDGAVTPMSMPSSGPSAAPGAMPNMGMMQMMQAMQTMMRGQSSDPLDHFEGRIAFLKAELGITDSQTQAWDQFAQALRADRQHLLEARQALSVSTSQSGTLNRLAAYEQHLSMRLDALRTAREAFVRLYGMLSDVQKRTADELALPFLEAF